MWTIMWHMMLVNTFAATRCLTPLDKGTVIIRPGARWTHLWAFFFLYLYLHVNTVCFFVHSSLGVANWLGKKKKKKNSITTRCKKHKAQRTMLAVLSDSFVLTPQNITLQLTLFLIATCETVMITSSKCLCSWIWILSVVSTPVKQIYLYCYILLSSAGTHHSGKQQNRALKEFATSLFKKKIQKHSVVFNEKYHISNYCTSHMHIEAHATSRWPLV